MQLTTQIQSFLRVIPQLALAVLCVLVIALSERMGWGIFRKGKGMIILIKSHIKPHACGLAYHL